ncbi:MAG: polyprenyl synthetase family protein [Candidatus Saganbacteria bacterium]|nr:polyprenyl synthetase family protein [Candidatus Saganbacteria bacterium]
MTEFFFDIKAYLNDKKQVIDKSLEHLLPDDDSVLSQAMRYSVLSSGKRFRPILVLASASAVGGKEEDVMTTACAIEMIHAFSLVHDDLPSMDDDDLRRGLPSCHKKFGEATAILAGDALLIRAFEVLAKLPYSVNIAVKKFSGIIGVISKAAGCAGMTGGQSLDLISEGAVPGKEWLLEIHRKKTAELLMASCYAGAKVAGAKKWQIECLKKYAYHTGMAFQIKDDILDVSGDPQETGKPSMSDKKKEKITFPSVFGLEASMEMLLKEKESALKALKKFDKSADPLREMAKFAAERNN